MSDREESPNPERSMSGPDEGLQSGSQLSARARQRRLLQLCYLDLAEERLHEAASMIDRAKRLGRFPFSPALPVSRQAIATSLARFGVSGKAKALQTLSSLLEQAQSQLSAKGFLEMAGSLLESGSAGEGAIDDPQWIDWLAGRIGELLAARMECAGRDARQAREDCQPWLEKVLASLLQAAKRLGEQSRHGQQLLAKAWKVLMSCRHPDLHCASRHHAKRPHPDAFTEAEQAFYRALRRELLKGLSARPQGWSKPLRRLQESLDRQPAIAQFDLPLDPPRQDASVAFFLFRDFFPDAALLVLARQQGKLFPRLIPEAQSSLIPQLLDWSQRLVEAAASEAEADTGPWAPGLSLQDLLPKRLSSQSALSSPGVWNLFPEGIFHAFPLEMLPDGQGGCFGQKREVQISLSRRPRKRARRPVRWERGWLAVGAVPRAGRIPEMEGSLDEVRALERLISKRKHPAEVLIGPQAHLSNLNKRLKDSRPSVLHLSVHSYGDDRSPEACTLVLAGIPGVGQSELLPFGLINRMDLKQLDLVVLSASAGLDAKVQSSSGLEGLIWAFLGAGAGQVIARRYPVDPRAARLFLLSLYRQLLKRPAALALGFARHECLGSLGLSRQQVGAWSIWN